ncbi:MAG: DNA polymerase III subunit gamma/tau, partial [Acidimicrobiales bacterium]
MADDAQAPRQPSPPQLEQQHQYQALYRRYRPQRFADVRGQEHVTRALRNAVREGRVAHAYLFSGPRGTGKTSTARILAMALNCGSPRDGEPDGICPSCLSVRSGASMDVFELDAASNRKLDEMRDLLSRVALGTPGRWKVYIVDEVHQLTPDSASALLKTLEEPPGHVVFVLATTDPQKVLPTIQSRTQHFEFHLLDGDLLTELLNEINRDAGLGLPARAVSVAVQRGRGSARDAESVLEQLAAAGGEEDDLTPLGDLVGALAQRDVGRVLGAVAAAISAGREPRRLGNDLVEHLRNAFLAQQAPSLVLLPPESTAQLGEQARVMGLPFLVRSMETLGQSLVEMRDSVDPRVTLEVALIRLASPASDASPGALLERVERLERALGERGAPPPPPPPPPPPRSYEPGPAPSPTSPPASGSPVPHRGAPAGASPGGPGPTQARVALGALLKSGPMSTSPVTGEPPGAPQAPSGPGAGGQVPGPAARVGAPAT